MGFGMSAQAMLRAFNTYNVHPVRSGEMSPWEAVNSTILADDPEVQVRNLSQRVPEVQEPS